MTPSGEQIDAIETLHTAKDGVVQDPNGQCLEFYIGPDGPDTSTPSGAVNLWGM